MGTMQANSETNPEVMKASIIQELGKEQVVAVAVIIITCRQYCITLKK